MGIPLLKFTANLAVGVALGTGAWYLVWLLRQLQGNYVQQYIR